MNIPYDEVDREDGEILLPKYASIMDGEDCRLLIDDLTSYTTNLCSAIKDACGMYNLEVTVTSGEVKSAASSDNPPVEAESEL